MKQSDIESIILNIRYCDGIHSEIHKIEKDIKKFQNKLDKCERELGHLKYYTHYDGQKLEIKRTFEEILGEISKENNTPRKKLLIKFDEKICGGYFFRTNETKVETIQKEIDARGAFTFDFSIASNKGALERNPLFCIYPLTDEEKARREKVANLKKNDPLYGDYTFNARPFSPMSNGVMLHKSLKREAGISVEMAWFFNVGRNYRKMYYYVEPKYIDIDDGSHLSKALKKLLTEDEIKEYYTQKKEYEEWIENKLKKVKECECSIKELRNKISQLESEINEKKRSIESLKWPVIKIRLGDFIEELYASRETIIDKANSSIKLSNYKATYGDTDEKRIDFFHLDIKYTDDVIKYNLDFKWKMSYGEKMYDGKTLYEHAQRKNKWHSWNELKNIKDFVFYFNPEYFLKKDIEIIISNIKSIRYDTIRKVTLKCIALEIARQEGKTKVYADELYEKYSKQLSNHPELPQNKNILADSSNSHKDKSDTGQISTDELLKLIRKDCNNFKTLDIKYRNYRKVALEAVIMDGLLLEYVSESLKTDDEIVMEALKSNPMALEFAGNKYKNDEKLVLGIVSRCGSAVQFATPRLKEDRNVALTAVKNEGESLNHLPNFKSDREIVLEAVKQNGLALRYADKVFFSDKEIVINALSQKQSVYLIKFISEDLKDDREVILTACKINKIYLECASEKLKDVIRVELIKSYADMMFADVERTRQNSKIKTKKTRNLK